MLMTTLKDIKNKNPCDAGWERLLELKGFTVDTYIEDNTRFAVSDIGKLGNLNWLFWTARLYNTPDELNIYAKAALFAADQVRHLMTDPRSITAIDCARDFIYNKSNLKRLQLAIKDAAAAAASASASADASAAYAAAAAASASASADASAAYAADASAAYAADASAAYAASASAAYAAAYAAHASADAAHASADAYAYSVHAADAADAAHAAHAAHAVYDAGADTLFVFKTKVLDYLTELLTEL